MERDIRPSKNDTNNWGLYIQGDGPWQLKWKKRKLLKNYNYDLCHIDLITGTETVILNMRNANEITLQPDAGLWFGYIRMYPKK